MSGGRIIASLAIAAVLIALFAWQSHRERLVGDCQEMGGAWNGPRGTCDAQRRIILRRALDRT